MNMRDPPLAINLAQHHGFDRAAVDGTVAVGAGDLFDTHNPGHIACLTTFPADEFPGNGGAERCVRFKVMRRIFCTVLLDAAGFKNHDILSH